jgi:hypothetical protein
MLPAHWRSVVRRPSPARRQRLPLRCEQLEPRCQPSLFVFNTGDPDGRMATASQPAAASNGDQEIESADDFILSTNTRLTAATFTGLLPTGASLRSIDRVVVEIYRVFPKDSDTTRTPSVPTRVNSPSDVAFDVRDSRAPGELNFAAAVVSASFSTTNSVRTPAKIAVNSVGNGAATGEEVGFTVNFTAPIDLPADHYFFVPQVLLSTGQFLWLSAPKPIMSPGTPFSPDLQSWIRDDPPLAPDWLRIGTDIVGGTPPPTFNGAFSLTGETVTSAFTPQITSLSQTSAAEGSSGFTLTVNGSDFTNQSTVLFNGLPLATTFVNSLHLKATVPANFLADEGNASITVSDPQRGNSNAQPFITSENVPSVSATVTHSPSRSQVTLTGQVFDQGFEGHLVRINWGDGRVQSINLGVGTGGLFIKKHHYNHTGPRRKTIKVTAFDDEGTVSSVFRITIKTFK